MSVETSLVEAIGVFSGHEFATCENVSPVSKTGDAEVTAFDVPLIWCK